MPTLERYTLECRLPAPAPFELWEGRGPQGRLRVKRLRRDARSTEHQARLRREWATLGRIDDPGVIRALELVEEDDRLALVTEAPEGLSPLADRFAGAPLPLDAILRIGTGIALALDAVHDAGLVHRSLKPSSVLCDASLRRFVLVDLDLASPPSAPADTARLQDALHSLAPEQTGRLHCEIDERADLYALGVILYQAATGHPPFDGSASAVIYAHLATEPTPIEQLAPGLPEALGRVVGRLLAKQPDERYQSSFGLRADLARLAAGEVAFAPGRVDPVSRFVQPRRLYGRDAEIARLEAWIRGRSPVVWVRGPEGSGRTTLVDVVSARLGSMVRTARGSCRSESAPPYGALVSALSRLLEGLLGEEDAAARERVRASAGEHGRIVTDLVPQARWLLGDCPPLPEVKPAEVEQRFLRTLEAFVASFGTDARPLLLVFDNLHRADLSTLSLLGRLGAEHVQIVATGDERETPALPGEVLALPPLGLDAVEQMIEEVTGDMEGRGELAAMVHARSGGNPLFATRLLARLHAERALRFDRRGGRWTWDPSAVARSTRAENVVELLLSQLADTPPAELRILGLAALQGETFAMDLLATAAQSSPGALRASLEAAAERGLILAEGEGWRFAHERIRSAARAVVGDEAPRVHARLARALLGSDDRLSEIVRHAGAAVEVLRGQPDAARFAEAALCAARRARCTAAYHAAAEAAAHALAMAPRESELWFEVGHELGMDLLLSGRVSEVEPHVEAMLVLTSDRIWRARLLQILSDAATNTGRMEDALQRVFEAVAPFGVALERAPSGERFASDLERTERALAAADLDAIPDLPPMTDEGARVCTDLLLSAMSPAYQLGDIPLFCVITFTLVRLGLEHGNVAGCGYVYGLYGMILSITQQRFVEAERFSRIGMAVLERYPSEAYLCRLLLVHPINTQIYTAPLETTLQELRRSEAAGRAGGELLYAGYAAHYATLHLFAKGAPLGEVQRDAERAAAFLAGIGDAPFHAATLALHAAASQLAGEIEPGAPLVDGDAAASLSGSPTCATLVQVTRLVTGVFLDEPVEEAIEAALSGLSTVVPNIAWAFAQIFRAFSLCRAGAGSLPPDESEIVALALADCERWARDAPETFDPLAKLLAAEVARRGGERARARDLLDDVVEAASASGAMHVEALANERAAALAMEGGRPKLAAAYLREAIAAYRRWGALAKVERLHERWEDLLGEAAAEGVASSGTPGLDLAAVLEMARDLASEVVLERLLERLMETLVRSAGAQRGVLALLKDGELIPRAEGLLESGEVRVVLDPDVRLPAGPTRLVLASSIEVLIDDCTADPRFRREPVFRERGVRSALLMPLLRQGEPVAVLYLEHTALVGAFTPRRLHLLDLLASGIAISIENATLYASLEAKVAQRTAQLEAMTRSVQQILDHVTFGFLLVDPSGRVQEGYSRSCEALLGQRSLAGRELASVLGVADPRRRAFLELAVEQVFADLLPEEVALSQLPSRFALADRVLRLEARSIRGPGGRIERLLASISDITALEDSRREAARNRMLVELLRQRDAFARFVADARAQLSRAAHPRAAFDEAAARRVLHTVKGNASLFGLDELCALIHAVESQPEVAPADLARAEAGIDAFLEGEGAMLAFDGRREGQGIRLEPSRIEALDLALAHLPSALAGPLRLWRLELGLVPASELLGSLERQVQRLAQRLERDVVLTVRGGEIPLDPERMGPILSNLSHLLRNALAHGIEPHGARGGKPPVGHIDVEVTDDGDRWWLSVEDDGRGIDAEALAARCVALGLLTPESVAALDHAGRLALAFLDRASTSEVADAVAGRGVGLAAVWREVRAAGGEVTIASEPGRGTRIALSVPKPPGLRSARPHGSTREAELACNCCETPGEAAEAPGAESTAG